VPAVRPPDSPSETPELIPLSAGTVLYRIHPVAFGAEAFNPTLSHKYFGGGRFDATDDDSYAFIYAGDSAVGAIAETLLRDSDIDSTGKVTVPAVIVSNRRISAVEVTSDVLVVNLTGFSSLRKCSQDTWLTQADPPEYAQTRHWGHWIRAQAPSAMGFVWRSKRDPSALSFVLFEDRCPPGLLADATGKHLPTDARHAFDDPPGRVYLRRQLATVNADIS
jgi:hypothetical protein